MLAGCSGGVFLPNDGPRRATVIEGASIRVQDVGTGAQVAYALIGLTPAVVANLQAQDAAPRFHQFAQGGAPAVNRIGVGDVIGLTVFEAAAGGLFTPIDATNRSGNYVTLPAQQVDQGGNITVPFGGVVHAAGATAIGLQDAIQHRLANRALEPQVVATVIERHANVVSVLGDVTQAARFTLDGGGERVLGALTRAGGPRYPAYETYVTVQRGGHTDRALLAAIGEDPDQNIELQPGDTVFVAREPRYFLTLGATGIAQSIGLLNKRIAFEDTRLSLTDALAKVGGLQDDRANPNAVFLYRFEPRAAIAAILGARTPADLPAEVPTIYTLDFTQPDSFFLASKLPMHSEDVIFVSNAPAADLAKVLTLLLPIAYSVSGLRTGVQ